MSNTTDLFLHNIQAAPLTEPDRQYYYIEKLRSYVEELAGQLGRKPVCCVTTFGCPTV